ncbi:MAG: hypothetical protein IPN42_05730 [Methylococcaceae bacterium]|nr:hypothetical protein [Methylococcaceae bacterium]
MLTNNGNYLLNNEDMEMFDLVDGLIVFIMTKTLRLGFNAVTLMAHIQFFVLFSIVLSVIAGAVYSLIELTI